MAGYILRVRGLTPVFFGTFIKGCLNLVCRKEAAWFTTDLLLATQVAAELARTTGTQFHVRPYVPALAAVK